MSKVIIPEGYKPRLGMYETQMAIGLLKRIFENRLCNALNLKRVSAPLFVDPDTGLNDDLNGIERPVKFDIKETGSDAVVVHSLAKWKRMALHTYKFSAGEGLYTDMNAIRRDEEMDNLHSIYTDQWDWEKIITREDRTLEYLKATVQSEVDQLLLACFANGSKRQTRSTCIDTGNFSYCIFYRDGIAFDKEGVCQRNKFFVQFSSFCNFTFAI